MILIAISGAQGSGKTVFSHQLLKKLQQDGISCQLIGMDDYYKERDPVKYPTIDIYRQDPTVYLPTHLCVEQLSQDLEALSLGETIYQKELIFETNFYKKDENRNCVLRETKPSEVIIMEGVFAQYFAQTYASGEYPIISVNVANSCYLNLLIARVQRDTAPPPIGRKVTKEQVYGNEQRFVGPVFFNYTAKHATGSDVYVLNDHENEQLDDHAFDAGIQEVMEKIESMRQALQSNQSVRKKTPPDAHKIACESYAIVDEIPLSSYSPTFQPTIRTRTIAQEKFQAQQGRSKMFGPFFKKPIVEIKRDTSLNTEQTLR